MIVKFYENGEVKFVKRFVSESLGTQFAELMEKMVKPSVSIETELYLNQFIGMNTISDIAKEKVLVKNLSESNLTADKLFENGIPSSICNLNEELVVQTSLDTAVREAMFELFSRIVCARDYVHLLHLNADSGGEHLMLEKIYEILDDMIDELGEMYFMARNIKIPNPLEKNAEYASGDLGDLLVQLAELVDKMCADYDMDESMKSLVSGFGEDFQRCMGFYRQAKTDSPNKINESTYIKREKEGANKYFCNLNGSPAWGPKDLAIQFNDEAEARKFLKKHDYLLSKDKIKFETEPTLDK